MNNISAIDMFNGRKITYPPPKDELRLRFDFHFTKKGVWYYINSCDDIKKFKPQQKVAEDSGEEWRIVESENGNIIKSIKK